MYRTKQIGLLFFIFIIVALIGCSGGGKGPVEPGLNSPADEMPSDGSETAIYTPDGLMEGGTLPILFGIYEVNIDPISMTGDIHPIRTSAKLGDSFMVDITPFLTITPCADCVDIKSIALSAEDYLEVTFQTKHPFAPGNRYDLHVFDLRGIIVNGDNCRQFDNVRIDMDGDGSYESPARGNVNMIVNPDGFTSFYDGIVEDITGKIFDGNICPFKNLWFDPGTEPPDTNYNPSSAPKYGFTDLRNPYGHNVFPMGATFENALAATTYTFDFSEIDSLSFLFILEASYGHTTTRWTRQEPRFFLPEFHRKDASYVSAILGSNSLVAGSPESSASLLVEIVDWQAGYLPSGGWDYNTSNLTETRYMSDIKSVVIDIPGVLSTPIARSKPDFAGVGSFDSPYICEILFNNDLAANEGIYWGLVAVRDDLEGSMQAPLGVSNDVMNPIKMHDITTYQAFKVEIEDFNLPPVSEILCNPNPVYAFADLTCSVGPSCLDPDGAIVKYEYMFNFDGTPGNFVADVTQNEGDLDFGDDVVTQLDDSQGNYLVALRVTDDLGAIDIDFENVQVLTNEAPVADVDISPDPVRACADVTISVGPLCNDPDGSIVTYEYMFDYDGTPGNFIADVTQNQGNPDFGVDVITQYDETQLGNHLIAQRVTDDLGGTDIDFENIQVNANQAPTAQLQDNDADNEVTNGDSVIFQPGALTNDPDGVIVKYEYDWDWDLDPAHFSADVTQNQADGDFGDPVSHILTNTTGDDIEITVGFRVTDDGCPDLTDIDYTTFTVHPLLSGLPIMEDFETTTGRQVPSNWGVTGRYGNAYYLNTLFPPTGCTDTQWRWGVTINTAQGLDSGSPGENHFLNEDGWANFTSDQLYTYQNRATIAYTPEFTVPPGGATLTIRHWYDTTFVDNWLIGWFALDGCRPIVTINNPDTITWTDFCNEAWTNHRPLRPLNVATGPPYHGVTNTTSANHPLWSMAAHTHSEADFTPSWRTNTYSLTGYINQTIRVGFLFGSDDIDLDTPNDCPGNLYETLDIFGRPGWRIQWVHIEAN